MDINQQHIIYEDVFTQEEIESIYNVINSGGVVGTEIVSIYCQKAYHFQLPDQIINKVTDIANSLVDKKLKLTEISFASYSKEYGDLPLLSPHFDNTFEEPRLTLDVQLRSNFSWPIVVRGTEFTLKDNQALTFAGTHQIHWRTFREFKEGEFIDMLFCHFSYADDDIKTTVKELRETVQESIYFVNKYYQNIIKKYQTQVKNLKIDSIENARITTNE